MEQTCLICKKTVKEQKHWVHCPASEGLICMKHCFNGCRYRKDDYCIYRKKEVVNGR